MKTCTCCGETKLNGAFSRPGINKKPVAHCKECGVWLRLLQKESSDNSREKAAERSRELYWAKKRSAGVLLDTVWRNT